MPAVAGQSLKAKWKLHGYAIERCSRRRNRGERMEVAFWQIAIILGIVFGGAMFGYRGLAWSTGIAVVWTVVMIFTSWLMIFQFLTIAVAGIVGIGICEGQKKDGGTKQSANWMALVGTGQLFLALAILGGAILLYRMNPEHFRNPGFGSLGFAAAYGFALLGAAIVGGAVVWTIGGLGWRNWSALSFRVGGSVTAILLAVIVLLGNNVSLERLASKLRESGLQPNQAPVESSPVGSGPREQAVAPALSVQTQQLLDSLPRPRPDAGRAETYSIVTNNVRVRDLLLALGRDAKINVEIHPAVTGNVTLNAVDQTIPQILTRISRQIDIRYEFDGQNLSVWPGS